MVFRSMVRDDAYIYDVVGLESEGTASDFQTGANSYLYGTRFMTWLCYTYGPEKLLAWITRGENTRRYFASRFKQVYGIGLNDAWKVWIADGWRRARGGRRITRISGRERTRFGCRRRTTMACGI